MGDVRRIRTIDERQLDVNMGQAISLLEVEKEKTLFYKKQKRNARMFTVLTFLCAVTFICIGISLLMNYSEGMKETLIAQREGLYSLNRTIVNEAPSRRERFEIFVKKGKAAILDTYSMFPDMPKMTDKEINEFLSIVFSYSEQYMIDPWIPMAVVRIESQFSRTADSYAGASGLFQMMPNTAKMLLGDEYFPGCEKNINWSTKMFFKHYLALSESFDGDLRWISASYVAGSYYPYHFYKSGKSFGQYYNWFRLRQKELLESGIIKIDHSEYMNRITYWFDKYKNM